MNGLPTFSLDTPPVAADSIHSGYNFREVAPEILSPFTWSVIGAGMEQGFRAAATAFCSVPPRGPRPHYVGYFGFRPFFAMTGIERILAELPLLDREDPWELLLGGPAPTLDRVPRAGRLGRARNTGRMARFLAGNGTAFGAAQRQLAVAEEAVLRAIDTGGGWPAGTACDAAVTAGRTAWALHIRTTCVAMAAAALLRRALRVQYDEPTAVELLRSSALRKVDGMVGTARAGALDIAVDRLNNYEVTDASATFGPFSAAAPGVVAASTLTVAAAGRPHGGPSAGVPIPLGTALGPAYQRLSTLLGVALGEREKSKEIGLRALHCTRVLLDRGCFGVTPDEAALLGVDELRTLSPVRRVALAAARGEEVAAAAALHYPVDVRQQRGGLVEARRPARAVGAGELAGTALAPGWAEGLLVRESDGEEGRILVGDRVDGNYVLATLPDGVVSRYGSVLSHVAIVCRELGIPFVAGTRVPSAYVGSAAAVDGWTGSVLLTPAPARVAS